MSRDAWEGDELRSQSLNGWSYVEGNPIVYIDPSGYEISCVDNAELPFEVNVATECAGGPPIRNNLSNQPSPPTRPAGPTIRIPVKDIAIKTALTLFLLACVEAIEELVNNQPKKECCPVPEPQPSPTPEPNQMRVQLQQSKNGVTLNTKGLAILAKPDYGVTVRQVQAELAKLYQEAQTLDWYKKTYNRALRKAIIETSQELNRYPIGGGVVQGENMDEVSSEFPGPNRSVYHVDVENLRGWNLRHMY